MARWSYLGWLLGLMGVAGLAGPALAGDRAAIDFIGYSEDSRYFAFEEFGISDGAGFAYSNVYLIDLSTDAWVSGTPIRVQAEDESPTLAAIRTEALQEAKEPLGKAGITVPVEIAALLGDGVADADGKSLTFGAPSYGIGTVSDTATLALTTYDSTSTLPCADWTENPPLGFALTLSTDGASRELHRDDSVPESRNCPQAYRLYGVVLPFGATDIAHGVAIVSVYPLGFEGPDRRFMAVPLAP